MDIICITGPHTPALNAVAALLQQAGMAAPATAEGGKAVDLARWHQQVLAANNKGSHPNKGKHPLRPVTTPGRLWDQLAGDLFVANIHNDLWGWADIRSSWLLDYWLNFEPNIKFILLCSTPEQLLADALDAAGDANPDANTDTNPAASADNILQQWLAQQQDMLRFYNRNPQRCLLLMADNCLAQPQALIETCRDRWQLPLTDTSASAPNTLPGDPILQFLVAQQCADRPELETLQDELDATVTRLQPALPDDEADADVDGEEPSANEELVTLTDVIRSYCQLKSAHAAASALANQRQQQLQQAEQNHQKTLQQHEAAIKQLQQERDTQLQAAQQQHQDAIAQLNTQLKDSKEENELLLLQLHQVQEELEKTFLQQKDTHAALQAAEQQLKQATQQHQDKLKQTEQAHNTQLKNLEQQHQATIKQLQQERNTQLEAAKQQHQDAIAQLNTQLKDSNEENELLLLQLHQVQEELEKTFLQQKDTHAALQAAEQQLKHATQQHQDKLKQTEQSHSTQLKNQEQKHQADIKKLQQERDAQQQAAQKLQNELKQLQQTHAASTTKETAALQAAQKQHQDTVAQLQAQLKDSNEENELLLLQLHQVQEELENYFLRHQEAQHALQGANQRWQRLLQQNPDYIDYQHCELTSNTPLPTWRFTQLIAGGRELNTLACTPVLENGIAGLHFTRSNTNDSPLLRWPAVAAELNELTVIPMADDNNRPLRLETLFDLSTSDWAMHKALASTMAQQLQNPDADIHQHMHQHHSDQLEPLLAGLQQLNDILVAFPATVRFDHLELKHSQTDPGYEHLWLRLTNVSFGTRRWPEFEFRLASVSPHDEFGMHSRLEFPQHGGAAPFTGWFHESDDSHGPKLDLRFAQPNQMDIGVWQQLPSADQQFVSALIKRLPTLLNTLQLSGAQLQRPWDDWQQLADDILGIHTDITHKLATALDRPQTAPENAGALL